LEQNAPRPLTLRRVEVEICYQKNSEKAICYTENLRLFSQTA
jgi:hypothetical protein